MALIKLKPVTPGQRFKVNVKTEGLHKGKPEKSLTSKKIELMAVTIWAALPLTIGAVGLNVV